MPLSHDMLWLFHLLKGALVSNGTIVSSLADVAAPHRRERAAVLAHLERMPISKCNGYKLI